MVLTKKDKQEISAMIAEAITLQRGAEPKPLPKRTSQRDIKKTKADAMTVALMERVCMDGLYHEEKTNKVCFYDDFEVDEKLLYKAHTMTVQELRAAIKKGATIRWLIKRDSKGNETNRVFNGLTHKEPIQARYLKAVFSLYQTLKSYYWCGGYALHTHITYKMIRDKIGHKGQ